MHYFVDFITSRSSNLVSIGLRSENPQEEALLKENSDQETIEGYYHQAIEEKLKDYVLLQVYLDGEEIGIKGGINPPYRVIGKVQKVTGLGR